MLDNDYKEIFDELKTHEETELIDDLNGCLMIAKMLRHLCKEKNLLNEQYYINWEDELNRISTMDPETDILEEILN